MTKWEKFFDEKIKEIAKGKTVFDIGGGSRFQKGLKAYKKYFSGCDYKTIDIDTETSPDKLFLFKNFKFRVSKAVVYVSL